MEKMMNQYWETTVLVIQHVSASEGEDFLMITGGTIGLRMQAIMTVMTVQR
jgi:hypothetical protein